MANKALVRFFIGLTLSISKLSAANDGDLTGKGLSQNHFYYILGMPPWAIGKKDNFNILRVKESVESVYQFRIGFALKHVFHDMLMNMLPYAPNFGISS